MAIDYETLTNLRRYHPAWKLLMAEYAPLIASFLHRVFIIPNVRMMAQSELTAKLDDDLFRLRQTTDSDAFPRSATEYLNDWADNDKGWLRKFYPPDSDEPHFDLTTAAEKAISWLESLLQRSFVGTESRLLTIFELLRQMVTGSEEDAETRIKTLEEHKESLDREIERIRAGDFELLNDTALKDRFQQLSSTARELLGDFREVEHNFRLLDQNLREQIATWEGRKGDLLAQIFDERDAIADSDQGKSFQAFWDFLMSPERQEELTDLLENVFGMESIISMHADTRLKRIHYDWLEAGEHTQRTVAKLSHQLRRYLDNKTYLENKRIMQLLQDIESNALAVRQCMPSGTFMTLARTAPSIAMPMERPLFSPPLKPVISGEVIAGDDQEIVADRLFDQIIVDKSKLEKHIHRLLQNHNQVTLMEVLQHNPVQQGLAEVVTYFTIAGSDENAVFDESVEDRIFWQDEQGTKRSAVLPRIIFNRQ